MIPWLLVVKLLSESDKTISDEVSEMDKMFPSSGELNFRVESVDAVMERISAYYSDTALSNDMFDGLSMEFAQWRFNLRSSATEPVLRLNIESRSDTALLLDKKIELTRLISEDRLN